MSDSETINVNDELIPENPVSEPVSPIDKILDYVTETPGNTNRAVLRSMLSSLETGGDIPFNIMRFKYHVIENTNLVGAYIDSDDIRDTIECTINLVNVGGSQSLMSTDWHYLNKEGEVPENIISYYNSPLLNYIPIEVYSALLQYVQDNDETIQTMTTAPLFTDSPTVNPYTPPQGETEM